MDLKLIMLYIGIFAIIIIIGFGILGILDDDKLDDEGE